MTIKGFQKVSLIDYPGKIASIIFSAGCNFRCPYCYNRDLVLEPPKLKSIEEGEIFNYLTKRRNLVDGVVITGGEPTLQEDLPRFAEKIKKLRFLVKLDTNGSHPTMLQEIIKKNLLDYVALDVKAPLDRRYKIVSGCQGIKVSEIKKSMNLLLDSGIDYEFRTTVVPTLHTEKDLLYLASHLESIAPRAKWFLQNFQPRSCLDPNFEKIKPYGNIFFEDLIDELKVYIPSVQLRR